MKTSKRQIVVNGQTYLVWSDFNMCCTYASNSDGNTVKLRTSGYLSNERVIKKAIKLYFE